MPDQEEMLKISEWAIEQVREKHSTSAINKPDEFKAIAKKISAITGVEYGCWEALPRLHTIAAFLERESLYGHSTLSEWMSVAIARFGKAFSKQTPKYGVCGDMAALAAYEIVKNYHGSLDEVFLSNVVWKFYEAEPSTESSVDEAQDENFSDDQTLIIISNKRFESGLCNFSRDKVVPDVFTHHREAVVCDPWIGFSWPIFELWWKPEYFRFLEISNSKSSTVNIVPLNKDLIDFS